MQATSTSPRDPCRCEVMRNGAGAFKWGLCCHPSSVSCLNSQACRTHVDQSLTVAIVDRASVILDRSIVLQNKIISRHEISLARERERQRVYIYVGTYISEKYLLPTGHGMFLRWRTSRVGTPERHFHPMHAMICHWDTPCRIPWCGKRPRDCIWRRICASHARKKMNPVGSFYSMSFLLLAPR